MKVAVVGMGGVGGFFGGKLAHAFQDTPDRSVSIYFVARGRHLEMIKRQGLLLKSPDSEVLSCRPELATDRLEDLPQIDVFIVSVKGYDLDEVSKALSQHVSRDTVILPLLNGVDIRERMKRHIRNGVILPSCVYLSSHIEDPGVVIHTSSPRKIILGPDPDADYKPDELLSTFREASILHEWREDILSAVGEKYVFIAGYGLVSARFNKTLGEIYEDRSLGDLVRKIMEEIQQMAKVQKISLPEDIVDVSLGKAQLFPRDTQTSLQRDIHQGKGKSELDLFGGTIVRQGVHFYVPTPVTTQIYRELLQRAQVEEVGSLRK
jgi:2-dehydropantoate 2-reductase